MPGRVIALVSVAALLLVTGRLEAQHGGGHGSSWHGSHGGGRVSFPGGGSGVVIGGGSYFFGVAPVLVMGPGAFWRR